MPRKELLVLMVDPRASLGASENRKFLAPTGIQTAMPVLSTVSENKCILSYG